MEKSEPTLLVPEWLRSAGTSAGGGSLFHHLSTSSSHSDTTSCANNTRNRTSRSIGDFDSPRPSILNRTYSANSRRGSNGNGSTRHAYSSFSRSKNRDRDRDKVKERSYSGDHWDHDSDTLGNFFIGRIGKDTLRRSHSVVFRKQGDVLDRKSSLDLKKNCSNNRHDGNNVLSGNVVGRGAPKAVLHQDFPALGAEERQASPDIGRVSSTGLNTTVQSLPVATSALVSGEGWSSALVEVPKVIRNGCMGSSSSSIQQTATSGADSESSTKTAGLNMAKVLTQPPSRAQTPPQLSVTTQKLEELTIKQSRQLIPMTPSTPKSLGLNSSDKQKAKTFARSADINGAAKSSQQQPSPLYSGNQLHPGGVHTKPDGPKKFLVLKPVWENGVSLSPKDATSPPDSTSSGISSNSSVSSPVASAELRSTSNPKLNTMVKKAHSSSLNTGSVLERKPSLSQAQSRSDFFKLMRKKSIMTAASASQDSEAPISSVTVDKSGEVIKELGNALESAHGTDNDHETTRNPNDSGPPQKLLNVEENGVTPKILLHPEEEEAAFLRSMGWDENAGEDEGLTEEEINSFYEKYMKLKPSSKLCRDMQLRLKLQAESHASRLNGALSEFGSWDSRSKA